MLRVGTAAWSIPRAVARRFPGSGTHLQRYARILPCAEINSSFYRSHAHEVYARWAAATPRDFRFSVKLPRHITHELELKRARRPLRAFLAEVAGLGGKLGPLLVQLPGSQPFSARAARAFFGLLRELHAGAVVCEPRNASWFGPRAATLLLEFGIGRVAADPARIPAAAQPEGLPAYFRLHGSPRMYWSNYGADQLRHWHAQIALQAPRMDAWCIFDNTASGAAAGNALQMLSLARRTGTARKARPARRGAARGTT